LDSPFAEKEVWGKIKQLPSDKALGPDGSTGGFYKACWMIIKQDTMAAIGCLEQKICQLGSTKQCLHHFDSKKDRS
jgi:hypothetical protein